MVFKLDQDQITHLKPWLIRTLEPICDAEPGALSDYVLALLKHDAVTENELRQEMAAQLDEFLEKECPTFLDTLFTVLRTKSFLPYATGSSSPKQPSTAAGIPIPMDGLLPGSPGRGRKRSFDGDQGRYSSKTPRYNTDTHFSRHGNGRTDSNWSGRESSSRDSSSGGNYGRRNTNYQPPDQKRPICRDYHNNGYCARGAQCKYRHGDDALVPGQLFSTNGLMPVYPMLPSTYGIPGAAYDPHESRMDMGNAQMLPRYNNATSGELPVIQDLTPDVPPNAVTPHPRPAPQQIPIPVIPSDYHQPDVEMKTSSDIVLPPRPPPIHHRPPRNIPGTFNGDAPNFRPERRKDKTLVMEKVPEEKLTLEHVNDWFKRFGTVTNVAIDRASSKALISFATHEEAYAAWKSEDAVFNNRFVKLFWHRPMEGHGQLGTKMLAASAPAVARLSQEKLPPAPTTPKRVGHPGGAAALAVKQQRLEQQIVEQKSLMASLDSATPDEKKEIMVKLRKLTQEMKANSSSQSSTSTSTDSDRLAMQKLDQELDLHNAEGSTEDESPAALKAKLERLKAEAASLGISDSPPGTAFSTYRPYRGRTRGARGYLRGMRGNMSRGSMKLDNRPKKLLVQGAPTDKYQALQDWYENTGQLQAFDQLENGDIVVSFWSRSAAEQGLAKGQDIPTIGRVQVSWCADLSPPSASLPKGQSDTEQERQSSTQAENPPIQDEEEVVATGWGGDNDEDGMGLL